MNTWWYDVSGLTADYNLRTAIRLYMPEKGTLPSAFDIRERHEKGKADLAAMKYTISRLRSD